MRFRLATLFLITGLINASCSSLNNKPTKAYLEANPPTPIRINGLLAVPRYSTHVASLLNCGPDTLGIEVNSTYVYYPFGTVKSTRHPNLKLLRKFKLVNRIIKSEIGNINVQILQHDSSKLILYFNTVNGSKYSEILKGEIRDTDVSFVNGIKVGMAIDNFYKCFFDQFPHELYDQYKFFELSSTDGIKHIYSFDNGKLNSVKLSSMRAFDTNY